MSLRTVLISLVVAGLLAGLVLISRGLAGDSSVSRDRLVRTLGIDPAAVVEVRVDAEGLGKQSAVREGGSVDSWTVRLDDPGVGGGSEWNGNAARARTVLRALGTATIRVIEETNIGDVMGTLLLTGSDALTTEIRFGNEASGGFVVAEIVNRGPDGIAKNRWFGRIERSLRDSMLIDGLDSWRSHTLFDLTISQVGGARVMAGGQSVGLTRTVGGWEIESPWVIDADGATVQRMLGLTLGLVAERFYEPEKYTDQLTGLDSPIATIGIDERGGGLAGRIEIGSGVDQTGGEVFARFTSARGAVGLIAPKTEGLNQLTAAPLAYVHQTAATFDRGDVRGIRLLSNDGDRRFVCVSALDSWEIDGVVASPGMREAIERLVGVLTRERAARIDLQGPSIRAGVSQLGEIVVELQDGGAVRINAGIEAGNGGIILHLTKNLGDGVGLVWVCGSPDAAGSGAWLGAILGAERSEN